LKYLKTLLNLTAWLTLVSSGSYGFCSGLSDSLSAGSKEAGYGTLQIHVDADTVFVYLKDDFKKLIVLTDHHTMELPEGRHRLRIFGKTFPETSRIVHIEKDEHLDITIKPFRRYRNLSNTRAMYAAHRWGANLMVTTDEKTTFRLQGETRQLQGIHKMSLPPGVYRIVFSDPFGNVQNEFVRVNSYQLTHHSVYMQPRRRVAAMKSIMPGYAQFYKREYLKSGLFPVLIGIGAGLSLNYHIRLQDTQKEFDRLSEGYRNALDEHDALRRGNLLDEKSEMLTGYQNRRNISLLLTGILYAVNIWDAFREPQGGFAKRHSFDPFRDFSINVHSQGVQVQAQVSF
jgi:hypothetical protein